MEHTKYHDIILKALRQAQDKAGWTRFIYLHAHHPQRLFREISASGLFDL